MIWIIMLRHVTQDRQPLKNREIIPIMIDNCWNPAIGRVFREPRLLLDILSDIDPLVDIIFSVGFLELFEHDGSLMSVWRAPS